MNQKAAKIQGEKIPYLGIVDNSNSAASAVCAAGAGPSACDEANRQMAKSTPGWSDDISSMQPSQPNDGLYQPGQQYESQALFYDAESAPM